MDDLNRLNRGQDQGNYLRIDPRDIAAMAQQGQDRGQGKKKDLNARIKEVLSNQELTLQQQFEQVAQLTNSTVQEVTDQFAQKFDALERRFNETAQRSEVQRTEAEAIRVAAERNRAEAAEVVKTYPYFEEPTANEALFELYGGFLAGIRVFADDYSDSQGYRPHDPRRQKVRNLAFQHRGMSLLDFAKKLDGIAKARTTYKTNRRPGSAGPGGTHSKTTKPFTGRDPKTGKVLQWGTPEMEAAVARYKAETR
jgi:hypothetical protein